MMLQALTRHMTLSVKFILFEVVRWMVGTLMEGLLKIFTGHRLRGLSRKHRNFHNTCFV